LASSIRSTWQSRREQQRSNDRNATLLYAINVTLDGCVHHNAVPTDEALLREQLRATHRHATESIGRADALLFGRITYQMMEGAWRLETRTMTPPNWTEPFARIIDAMKKYVVSSTLDRVDWNAELVRGNLDEAVRTLKRQPGKALFTGGVKLPLALAELDLIDEYEFVVQPRIAGHGPTLFAGLSKYVELRLLDRQELSSGAVALLRYEPRR
jgi:dihydrofolate reductase